MFTLSIDIALAVISAFVAIYFASKRAGGFKEEPQWTVTKDNGEVEAKEYLNTMRKESPWGGNTVGGRSSSPPAMIIKRIKKERNSSGKNQYSYRDYGDYSDYGDYGDYSDYSDYIDSGGGCGGCGGTDD